MANELSAAGCGASGGTAVTTLVQDNFNTAGNGTNLSGETPLTGPSPALAAGAAYEFQIENGTAAPPASNQNICDVYTLTQADVTLVSNPVHVQGSNDIGFVCRYQSQTNYWYLCYDALQAELLILECSGGSFTTRASASATINGFKLKAVLSGTSLSVTATGAGTINYTSSDYQASTNHGIGDGLVEFASSALDYFNPLTITHP